MGSVAGRTAVLLGVVGASSAAFLLRDVLAAVVPRPSELVANLWAGALAAVGAVYLQRIALVKADPGVIIRRSFNEIDLEIGRYAVQASQEQGVRPQVCLSVMAAENAQRPKWVRTLEWLIPAQWRTAGIMQQTGARTDKESVDLALARYFVRWGEPELDYDGAGIAGHWIEEKPLDYNSDADFAALVRIAVETLNDRPGLTDRFM